MLWLLVVFILQVFLLTQLKKEMVTLLWKFSDAVTGSVHLGVWIYALVFFPGTLLHELSHLLTAEIVRVKAQEIVLFPKTQAGSVTLGYVRIEKTDPLRSLLIGTAPFLTGLVLLVSVIYFGFHHFLPAPLTALSVWQAVVPLIKDPKTWLGFYLIIVVSHSMFLSEADQSEIFIIPMTAIIIGGIVYFLRNSIVLPEVFNQFVMSVLTLVTISLSVVLVFNLAFLLVLYTVKSIFGKLF